MRAYPIPYSRSKRYSRWFTMFANNALGFELAQGLVLYNCNHQVHYVDKKTSRFDTRDTCANIITLIGHDSRHFRADNE